VEVVTLVKSVLWLLSKVITKCSNSWLEEL